MQATAQTDCPRTNEKARDFLAGTSGRGFNKFFYTRLIEVEQAAVTKKEAFPLGGLGACSPRKI